MFAKFYDVDNCMHLKTNERTEEEALKIAKKQTVKFIQLNMKHQHSIGGKYYRFKFLIAFILFLMNYWSKIAKLDLKTVNNFRQFWTIMKLKSYGIISENF